MEPERIIEVQDFTNYKLGHYRPIAVNDTIFYDLFLKPLSNHPLNGQTREKIKQIQNLTPGDFKVVRDRYSFCSSVDIDHNILIKALQEESQIKARHHDLGKRIGF